MANKRVFNSELAIKLRNDLNITQIELVDRLAEKHKDVESLSISMRTIRDLENSIPVDVRKGISIFRELGHKHTEEIYSPDDQPSILPLFSVEIFNKYIETRQIEIEFVPGEVCLWEQLPTADKYYLHIGNVDDEFEKYVLEFLKLVSFRGKFPINSNTDCLSSLLEHKMKISKFTKLVNENKLGVYSKVLENHFNFYKGISEDHASDQLSVYNVDPDQWPDKIPELEDLFESEYIGPSRVLLLGIVGNGDKNLRVTSYGTNVLLFRDNFSESDLLDFSTKKIFQEPTGCYIKDGESSVQLIETHEFNRNTRYQGEQIGVNEKNNLVIVNEIVVRNFSVYVRRGVWDAVNYEKHNS